MLHWFKSYSDFAEVVEFAFWWSGIRKCVLMQSEDTFRWVHIAWSHYKEARQGIPLGGVTLHGQ